MTDARNRLALGLILLVPIAGVLLLSVPPWEQWLPDARGLGRPWLYATTMLGGLGIGLLRWRWPWRLLALLVYLPAMFVLLLVLSIVTLCVAHGPQACP